MSTVSDKRSEFYEVSEMKNQAKDEVGTYIMRIVQVGLDQMVVDLRAAITA